MIDRYFAAPDECLEWGRTGTGEDLIPIYDRRAVGSLEPVAYAFGVQRAHDVAKAMNLALRDAP